MEMTLGDWRLELINLYNSYTKLQPEYGERRYALALSIAEE
tara:strand:+ start:8559 stop:8681 length:123 start_codon:yes stop_codon:yes gene_type:complete